MPRNFCWMLVMALLGTSRASAGFFYEDGTTTLHFAFEGSPNGDRPIVRAPGFYRADDGFGFVDSPGLIGTSRGVTAPKYFRFDVNLPPGNYDVTVTMGGTESASVNTVKAEGHRPMLADVRVGRDGSVTRTFTVNVRHAAAAPGATTQPLDLDNRLTLEFVGSNPSLMKLDIVPNTKAVTVYLAGDETVADHDDIPLAGWGEMLPLMFKAGEVAVSNQAGSEESSAEENRLKSIASTIKAGDYLLVQFNNNAIFDRPGDGARFKSFLQTYIDVARTHQATAVLVTPAPGKQSNTLCSQWMLELEADQNVPVITLNTTASALFNIIGPNERARFFGRDDKTHFSPYGAFEMAKMVEWGIEELQLDLANHLVRDNLTNSFPAQFPPSLGFDYFVKDKQQLHGMEPAMANRDKLRWLRLVLRWVAAVGFVAAGANHFYKPGFYQSIVPPGFPQPAALVAISGVCEIAGGIGLLVPKLRRAAGWGLVALLVCVFPANVYMAVSDKFAAMGFAPWELWARLPLQAVFIAWVCWVSARDPGDEKKP